MSHHVKGEGALLPSVRVDEIASTPGGDREITVSVGSDSSTVVFANADDATPVSTQVPASL